MAPADSVWLMIGRPYDEGIEQEGSIMRITSATMYKYNWTVSPGYTGTLGLPIFNPYRFAYNGMERVDEKAGRANHYTALYGEYDPRKAYRENQDPKTAYGWSPYAMFGGNPIWYNDPLLDEKKKYADLKSGKEKVSDFDFNKDEVEMDEVVVKPGGSTGGVGLTMSSVGGKSSGRLFGGSGNLNIWQAAERGIGRNDANRKKIDDLNTFMQGFMYSGISMVGGIGAIGLAGRALWGMAAMRGTSDALGQYLTNGREIGGINITSSAAAAFIPNSFASEAVGQGFSFSVNQGFQRSFILGEQNWKQYSANILIAGSANYGVGRVSNVISAPVLGQTRIGMMKDYLILGKSQARGLFGFGNFLQNTATSTVGNAAQNVVEETLKD